MSDIRYRDRILEAIDQLRHRKARPDIHRICNYLLKRFSINFTDAKNDLQRCVDNDIVLKVEYKGNISYRNAARKFKHLKKDGRLENSGIDKFKIKRKFSAILNNAIAELIVQEPDYLEIGVPGSELIKNILSKDNVKYTKKYVSILLEKEVENGGLMRMDNGNYLVGPAKSSNSENINANKEHVVKLVEKRNFSSGALMFFKKEQKHLLNNEVGIGGRKLDQNSQYGNLRVGSRRKRAKKVFDPSDNNIPRKRGRPTGSINKVVDRHSKHISSSELRPDSRMGNIREQGGVCSVCHNNARASNDRFVSCRECSNKAHFSCLNGDDNMMLRMYPDNTWQCPHCKTCIICFETSDAGSLIVCSICADAYHAGCHQPRITEKIRSGMKWLCINCQMPEQLGINDIQSHVITGDRDKIIINGIHRKSPSPSVSGNSSPLYRSLQPSPTPPTLSPQANRNGEISPDFKSNHSDSQSLKDLDLEENIDPTIPDATNWSYDDVYNYFARYFPNEAKVFKDQEIDGRSLLLMRRIDVLTSLKLKLGPALKIYRHVVKLQHRRDDPKLYWL